MQVKAISIEDAVAVYLDVANEEREADFRKGFDDSDIERAFRSGARYQELLGETK